MLLFGWGSKQTGLALVFEPITFSIDADDDGVVQDAMYRPKPSPSSV